MPNNVARAGANVYEINAKTLKEISTCVAKIIPTNLRKSVNLLYIIIL